MSSKMMKLAQNMKYLVKNFEMRWLSTNKQSETEKEGKSEAYKDR